MRSTIAILGLAFTACLPKDTRPVPGSIHVTVSAKSAPSWITSDGWSVTYDRFLIDVGHANLSGDSCAEYSDARYDRIFDGHQLGPQKVSESYALGHCSFRFRLNSPDLETLLGAGVTEADKTEMRTPGSDFSAKDRGVSLLVAGHATKEGVEKSFSWSFRRRVGYSDCAVKEDDANRSGVVLRSGETLPIASSSTEKHCSRWIPSRKTRPWCSTPLPRRTPTTTASSRSKSSTQCPTSSPPPRQMPGALRRALVNSCT